MSTSRRVLASAALFAVGSVVCVAQNIAPAHSGTVHYFEGDVTVDGVKVVAQVARFTELQEQATLHTGMGRAEILLTPGVVLRVGENTSVKMLDNRLMSTRVEFLSGSAMLEAVDAGNSVKDPAVTIVYKDFEAQSVHNGIFELTSQPEQLRVFKGEAKVVGSGTSVNVKDGNVVDLASTMATAKFDAKDGDDLYLWSRDRSAYLAAGNMASARALGNSGYGNGLAYAGGSGCGNGLGYGSGLAYGPGMAYGSGVAYGGGVPYAGWNPNMWRGFNGGWYYNQCLNMYSYMPFAGTMYGPFGYGLYNPVTIAYVYAPGYFWTGAGGSRTGSTTGLPLPTLATSGSPTKPVLPRLGTTATSAPTLSLSARSTASRPALLAERSTVTSAGSLSSSSALSTVSARSATVSAPAMSAAPARAAGGRR
jgi:hypothetical protein